MKRHLLIVWRLALIGNYWPAIKHLFGRYPLAEWEKDLLSPPRRGRV